MSKVALNPQPWPTLVGTYMRFDTCRAQLSQAASQKTSPTSVERGLKVLQGIGFRVLSNIHMYVELGFRV